MFFLFHGGMNAGAHRGTGAGPRFAAAHYVHAQPRANGAAWVRPDESWANSASFAIVFSLFLALLAAALLVGGHAVIDPLLQSAAAARDANRVAEVLYALPDRAYCRHLSFDNATAEMTAGGIEPCPGGSTSRRAQMGFTWGSGR